MNLWTSCFLIWQNDVDLEELYQFAQIVSIAKRSGGNLIEITDEYDRTFKPDNSDKRRN